VLNAHKLGKFKEEIIVKLQKTDKKTYLSL